MSKRTSLSVIGVLLTVLLLAVLASSYAKADELTPLERAIEGSRAMLADQRGYVGPWSASCRIISEDALACFPTAQPLMQLSTCDDCVKAGEIVCGKGKVDPTKTKKDQSAVSQGKGCNITCTDGTLGYVACTIAPAPKPLTIVDEPDPAGERITPVPMGEKK